MAIRRSVQDAIGTAASLVTLDGNFTGNQSSAIYTNEGQLVVEISYDGNSGAAEDIEVQLEFANPHNTNRRYAVATADWFVETAGAYSAGVTTLVQNGYTFAAITVGGTEDKFRIEVPSTGLWTRVSVKGTGTAHVKLVTIEDESIN